MFSTRPFGTRVGCDPPMMLMLYRMAMSRRDSVSRGVYLVSVSMDSAGLMRWSSMDSSCSVNISGKMTKSPL